MKLINTVQSLGAVYWLLVSLPTSVNASVSVTEINRYWTDASSILNSLDQYQALWVKFHNCVWSECAVDDNDDDGEGRDGDEKWYQNRVQHFCANAAYSLYGIPKNWISVPLMGCTRSHYIDSFFTYNSSDTFLNAIGHTSKDRFENDDSLEWGEGNAACHGNGDGTSRTLGCTKRGKFGMAEFNDDYCDGNYFSEITDNMAWYNHQISTHCHMVYGRNGWLSGSTKHIESLLENSWSCDIDLYPKGCPDPYQRKQITASALHAASKGWNPQIAYNNARFKRPIRITAWILCIVGVFFFLFSYRLSNKERIKKSGGGLRGMLLVAREDYEAYKQRREQERRERLQREYDDDNKIARRWRRKKKSRNSSAPGDEESEDRRSRRKERRKKKKRSSKSRSKSRNRNEGGDYENPKYEEDWALPDVS